MTRASIHEEIKGAVFNMNKDNASRPDSFTGVVFQACWEIVKQDVVRLVMTFFYGSKIPKYVTHTNVVLIPKREKVTNFVYLTPINLSSFLIRLYPRFYIKELLRYCLLSS